ncbi:MAG: CRISPR system precrRNA processing endoribonuclease RAMP protein Cas6 [Actinomycetaceae bacterium]|nr:CRISPR system precrRNA processing endoribonuclease RAMP protein Cas6 [Actinomycetaceae bacterium]
MPATFLLPLPDISKPVNPIISRAAFTKLLDNAGGNWGHKPDTKPYTISQVFLGIDGQVYVEISVLTDLAERSLRSSLAETSKMRFGKALTRLGELEVVSRSSWDDIAQLGSPEFADMQIWELEFFTPTLFRSGDDASAFPLPSAVLRAAAGAWESYAPIPIEQISHKDAGRIEIVEFDIHTVPVTLPRPAKRRDAYGFVGTMRLECRDMEVRAKVAPLFGLIPYCGVGSYRNLGYGLAKLVSTT